ncbi:hypothetical protein DFJ67_1191 [Asanoa ferruginea]|uniref:Basic secretory peptidase family protein n=1 Tax=Asanoa ferruginea TaxID=53367 RepID=A0A3D9ZCU5_9ACTN|nr:hypothetical protein [Asanoa ferruginea]REF95238.1 hypothetical protein DFJ67_1191 [Asanoa ferruginea]GIF48324.1 hypothetical protein Afe04nite_28630 [Asanoa ferruginea]
MINTRGRRFVCAVVAALAVGGAAACTSPSSAAGPAPSPAGSVSASPDKNAPAAEAQAAIEGILEAQSAALVKGDLAAYLAPAAGYPAVEKVLKQRFTALRALRVSDVRQTIAVGPSPGGEPDRWSTEIGMAYCLGAPGCKSVGPISSTAFVRTPAGFRIADLDQTTDGPRPWEVSDLVVRFGKRVVVATTKPYAKDLPTALRLADAAATVADKFSLGETKPYRYVVYLAGQKEWKAWYDNTSFDDSYIGFAVPRRIEGTDLVLRLKASPIGETGMLLRHEMTHVASGANAALSDYDGSAWWLNEGLAELAGENGAALGDYGRREDVRRYLGKNSYKGDLATAWPSEKATDDVISAKYGIAYYATRCIDEKYGRKKLMALVDALVRHDASGADAAPTALGASWKTVQSTCLSYTRRAVGL